MIPKSSKNAITYWISAPRPASKAVEIMFAGTYDELLKRRKFAHRRLSKPAQIDSHAGAPAQAAARSARSRSPAPRRIISKNIDVEIPLGMLVCITGVSGSGKSSSGRRSAVAQFEKTQGSAHGQRHRLRRRSTASRKSPKSSWSISRRWAPRRAPTRRLT